ncbi:MAG: hypothetical protein AAGA23_00820 [Pseudomonadota bacterium]
MKHGMQQLLALTTITAALLVSGTASAGTYSPGIDARQHNQVHRIGNGVATGALTRPETVRLVNQQRAIRQTERAFKSDGHLGRYERVTLRQMQNGASRSIHRQKHDAQRRR